MRKKNINLIILLLICAIFFWAPREVYAEEDLPEAVEMGEERGIDAENINSVDDTDPEDQDEPAPEIKNGWYDEEGELYYYANGVRQTGWLELEEGKYYLNEDGIAVHGCWIESHGDRYYLGDDYRMAFNTWQEDGGDSCFLLNNGKAAKSQWIEWEDAWYYIKSDYHMAQNQWQKDTVGWCYLLDDGTAANEKWIWWGNAWYYLKADCRMAANTWQRDSVGWCYLLSDGRAAQGKWISWRGGWYYINGLYHMVENKWVRDSAGWCYLGADGKAYSNGWKWIGKTDYKFSSSSRMVGAWMDVPCYLQNPELPTGCESVALTNDLNYYGFGLSKTTMAASYVARSSDNGNFVTAFHGNPYSQSGGMICAPGIVLAANKYLSEKSSNLRAHELTGSSLWSLCQNHVANGRPVIIWTSIRYSTGGLKYRTQAYMGRTYFAHTLSHTVVLNGFDEEENVVWISDSISGKVKKSYSLVDQVYVKHGNQAVVLY